MNDVRPDADTTLVIRKMAAPDIAVVLELEHLVFPDPWPREAFLEQLGAAGWNSVVAVSDNNIVGYACWMIVLEESHLTNIAVHPEYRRKSVASRLLDHILQDVIGQKCELLLLEVRPSNSEAIAFYTKYGFKSLYRRPRYYRRPVEDALVLVKYLDTK